MGEPQALETFTEARGLIAFGDPGIGQDAPCLEAAAEAFFETAKPGRTPSTELPLRPREFSKRLDSRGDGEEALRKIVQAGEHGCAIWETQLPDPRRARRRGA